jgi:MFS superfamily sulfate permease-like transporter
MDYVDTKIPRIMGKPALRECLANIKPGMTVALVSLPLSISLAIAADAQPVQGVITAVWAGIVSAIAGGSHFNIVGPTGALSGILSFYQLKYPIVGILPLMAILSGFLALLVWVSRMDSYLVFIPGAVMHGFTLGVAFIIAANQLNFLLGLPQPCPKGTDPHHPPRDCLLRHPEFIANLYETFRNVGKTSLFAICFFAASFAALFNLANKYGKVPWAVLLAIAGILVGWAVEGTALPLQTIKSRYKNLSIQLVAMLDSSQLPTMDVDTVSDLFRGSVSICAVAVLETLISARIADRMTKTIFDQPREVLSVGLANLASGLTGGIPATAALARTALNVKTGATSRGSGIVSAVMIMLLSSVLFSAFQYLPLPVVATILVNTAYRMVEWHEIHLLMDTDRPMMVVCIVTMIICAVQDPTMGIVYGTGFSMIRVLLALMHGHSHLYVFQGTLIELSTEFKLNNGADSVPVVRRRFLKEVDPVEVEKEKQRIKAAEAVTSSANAIAAAASALRIAEEDSRATAQALVAAASGKASSAKTRKALNATMQTSGGTDALAASAAAAAINTVDDAPEFLKGMPAAPEDARLPKVAVYEMPGYCTYVGAKSHLDRIRGLFVNKATCLPGIDVVAFSMEECKYADPDALEAMGDVVMVRALPAQLSPHARTRARTLCAHPAATPP